MIQTTGSNSTWRLGTSFKAVLLDIYHVAWQCWGKFVHLPLIWLPFCILKAINMTACLCAQTLASRLDSWGPITTNSQTNNCRRDAPVPWVQQCGKCAVYRHGGTTLHCCSHNHEQFHMTHSNGCPPHVASYLLAFHPPLILWDLK